MKKVVLLSALLITAVLAHAQDAACGPGFSPSQCAAQDRANKAAAEAEARMQADREKRARERSEREASNAKWRAERDAVYAAQEKARAEEGRRDDAEAKKAEAAQKSRCGADYKKPRVGMTMERALECVSPDLQQVSQAHTAQGVVTTYQSGRGYVRALGGKVLEWGTF